VRVLFIGGSGIISSACSQLAAERGIDLFVLNRGLSQDRPLPAVVTVLRGDIRDPASVRAALGDREFDAVVDWVAFTPGHVQADIGLFRGRTGQYVFISSASAYQTPPARVPILESTPLRNPWGAGLLGDKSHSLVFDNAKLRSVVPGYRAVIPFEHGAREIVAWYGEDPARQRIDARVDAVMDKLIETCRPR
jgi:nucleoside-diphosphate-sugar epimerase